MLTARDYFDQTPYMTFGHDLNFEIAGEAPMIVSVKIAYDFEAGAKFLVLYIPQTQWADAVLADILSKAADLVWAAEKDTEVSSGLVGHDESILKSDLNFTGRVMVWTPAVLGTERWRHLQTQAQAQGVHIVIRDGEYVARRASFVGPAAPDHVLRLTISPRGGRLLLRCEFPAAGLDMSSTVHFSAPFWG